MSTRYVYFIQQGKDGPIKIGVASNPIDRMVNLQMGSGYELALLGVTEESAGLEKMLHRQFSHLRLHYEWFSPDGELLDYITDNATPWPHAVPVRRARQNGPNPAQEKADRYTLKGLRNHKQRAWLKSNSPLAILLADIQGNKSIDDFAAAIGLSGGGLRKFYEGKTNLKMSTIWKISLFGHKINHPLLIGTILKHCFDFPLTDDQCKRIGQRAIEARNGTREYNVEDIFSEAD